MPRPDRDLRPRSAALAAALAAGATEIWVARVSDGVLWLQDVALEISLLASLGVVCGQLAAKLPARAARVVLLAPVALWLAGMALYSLADTPDARGLVVLAPLALLLAGGLLVDSRRPRRAAQLSVAAVSGWALATWMLEGQPPPALLGAAGGGSAVLFALCWMPAGAAMAVLVAGLAALTPMDLYDPLPAWETAAPVPEGPDLLMIVVDTLRADQAASMEVVAQLAGEGRAFGQVQAAGSWTLPSVASLQTGLPVSGHRAGRIAGTDKDKAPVDPAVPTLAEQLAVHGYDTAAVLAQNPNISERLGFDRGFAVFDFDAQRSGRWALPSGRTHRAQPLWVLVGMTLAGKTRSVGLRRALAYGRRRDAGTVLERASAVLERRRERPLFLWVHLMEPHLPYRHIEEAPVEEAHQQALVELSVHDVRDAPAWEDEELRQALRDAYAFEVERVDEALVEFLASLPPPPPAGRVVVLTADHGEEFWEHGGFEHGHALYQEVIQVPLVISGVSAEALRPADEVVGHEDIAPTLLQLAGVSDTTSRTLLRETPAGAYTTQNLLYGDASLRAVRRGDLKRIQGERLDALFDLSADPGEHHSLEAHPELEELTALLPTSGAEGEKAEFDESQREALRKLGYLE